MGIGTAILYEAGKVFIMGGVKYRPGDPVDVSKLPDHKVGQLLNQRWIRPAPPVDTTTDQ